MAKAPRLHTYGLPLLQRRGSTRTQTGLALLSLIMLAFFATSRPGGLPSTNTPPPASRGEAASRRRVKHEITLGIKSYVCDERSVYIVQTLLASVRARYAQLQVLIANDGPMSLANAPGIEEDPNVRELRLPLDSGISVGRNRMVNETRTPWFMLLDDDHLLDVDGGDLDKTVNAAQRGSFDVVGVRVRNLPGIAELEDIGVVIPRYVSNVTSFEQRIVTLCVWDENAGPSVEGMQKAVRVDVVHNAFLARTESLRRSPWRDELKVNEHMTFFLDARRNGLKVGYLPSVLVHHRARRPGECYRQVREREDSFEKLLDYRDSFEWNKSCYKGMVEYVRGCLQREREERAQYSA